MNVFSLLTLLISTLTFGVLFQIQHYSRQMCIWGGWCIFILIGIYWCDKWEIFLGFSLLLLTGWIMMQYYINKYLQYCNSHTETDFFSKKKVLVFVPHQDDEINLTSDILDNFICNGSEVNIVFATNGDYCDNGERRMQESLQVCNTMGIDNNHVFFLGYGDQWQGLHIYNADQDETKTSHAGYNMTYALNNHSAFHQKQLYTRRNYLNDIKEVITFIQADVIFAVDYDGHIDHKATCLLFDEALGEVLKNNTTYKPHVYKGFCYSTAYYGKNDFKNSINIESTVNINQHSNMKENIFFKWENRIRMPITSSNINRALERCKTYKLLSMYTTQPTLEKAGRIINGDKVFWERSTISVLYDASITDKYGRRQNVNNFKLLDCKNLLDSSETQYNTGWFPSEHELQCGNAVLYFKLPKEQQISKFIFYANPIVEGEILNIRIDFADGSYINTGKISKGEECEVCFSPKVSASFSMTITDYIGEEIGITEIEGYSYNDVAQTKYIKLMDEHQNFVYDLITVEPLIRLGLYSYPKRQWRNLDEEIEIIINNSKCSYSIVDDYIKIVCPKKETCIVQVRLKGSHEISDTVQIQSVSAIKLAVICYFAKHCFACFTLYYRKMFQIICEKMVKLFQICRAAMKSQA